MLQPVPRRYRRPEIDCRVCGCQSHLHDTSSLDACRTRHSGSPLEPTRLQRAAQGERQWRQPKGVAALVAATNAANRALAAEAVAKQQPIHSIFAAAPPARPIFAAGPPANPMFAAAPAAHPIFAAAPAAEADDEDSNAETLQMCDDDDDDVHSSALQSAEADDEAEDQVD